MSWKLWTLSKNLSLMQILNTVWKYNVSILVVSSPLFLHKLKWFNKQFFFSSSTTLTSIRKCHFINWLIIFKQTIFSRRRIQSLNLIFYKYNTIQKNVKFLFTNKQNSGASETFWIKWMYQLEEISHPQLYPRACICLMMYFKNNWNAGPFFLLH